MFRSLRCVTWMSAAVFAGGASHAQESTPDLLYRAFYEEVGRRDFERAEALYARAIADLAGAKGAAKDGEKTLLVKCRVGRARCLVELGRKDDAEAELGRALELAPEDAAATEELAKLRSPDALAPGLAEEIGRSIETLGGPGNVAAHDDLIRMGDVVVPLVAQALRDVSIGRVSAAASVLTRIDTDASWRAIGEGLRDPRVVFPAVVLTEVETRLNPFQEWGLNERAMRAIEGALARPEEEIRLRGAALFLRLLRYTAQPTPAAIELVGRVRGDPAPAVGSLVFSHRLPAEAARALVPVLNEMLESKDVARRRLAIGAIHSNIDQLGDAISAASITRAQQDPDPQVRASAFTAEIERDEHLDRRRAAVTALRLLNDADPGNARKGASVFTGNDLASLLPPETHDQVVVAMRRLVEEPGFDTDYRKVVEPLVRLPFLTVEELIDVHARIGSSSSQLREESLQRQIREVLAERGDRSSADDVVVSGLQRIEEPLERRWWFDWWRKRAEASMLRSAIVAANDPSTEVRYPAYRLLSDQRRVVAPRELRHLAEDLTTIQPEAAEKAFRYISLQPDPSFTPALRQAAERFSGETKHWVVRQLARSAGDDALPDVRRAILKHRDEAIASRLVGLYVELARARAVEELVVLAKELDPAGASSLLWLMSQPASQVPQPVVDSFVRALGPQPLTGDAIRAAAGRLSLATLSQVIETTLQGDDPYAQLAAIEAAGSQHVESAWPSVARFLDAGDGDLRDKAATALVQIRNHRELRRAFAAGLDDERRAAFEAATGMLKSGDPMARNAAALALGALADVKAVPLLLELMNDSDPGVRLAAMKALERISAAGADAPAKSDAPASASEKSEH